jgi:hypothetical protein
MAYTLVALLAACSDEPPLPPLDLPPEPASAAEEPVAVALQPAYTVVEVAHPGIVTGAVRWRGLRPRLPALAVSRRQNVCGHEQPSPVLVLGPGGGVANAVVTIEVDRGLRRATPADPPVLERRGCRFTPHVLVTTRGEPLLFRNADAILHNVDARFIDGEPWLELGLPRLGQTHAATPERTGVAHILCDAGHPWESAFVHVVEHPYVAVTGPDGAFRIEGVPSGEQTVRVWHEAWEVHGSESGRPIYGPPRTIEQRADVPPGGEVALEITLAP